MDLFSPLTIRDVVFRNRIAVSPMCQYSCEDGFASDWHLVHLGSRAVGGAALVMAEATAVEARGRISPQDLGIWKDEHIAAFAPIAHFIRERGAVPGVQLAHAGRKASTQRPWEGGRLLLPQQGGWRPVAPSAIPFHPNDPAPEELSAEGIHAIVDAFADAANRALKAGFQVVEIHSAHGYLSHEFLSPLTNRRTDQYGGSFENRTRFTCEIVNAVRRVWPASLPLLLRISATDWTEGGWSPDDSVQLAKLVKPFGVDAIDCSSGGIASSILIEAKPGYQVPFAAKVRREADILTGAVGMITEPVHANSIVADGEADLVLLARELLRDPYWPIHAARTLGRQPEPPVQYARAFL